MGCDFVLHIGEPTRDGGDAFDRPFIVVAEASFLKYGLTGDKRFVPEPVMELSRLLSRPTVIDDGLIEKVKEIEWKNNSVYELYMSKEDVIEFLQQHKGEKIYYECW